MAAGGLAFLLRWLTWREAALMAVAALLFNWRLLPLVGGRALWREHDHGRGYPRGILLYPVSVLALVLVFRHELWKAAVVWGILAWGDGMATLVGQALGGPRLPWNHRKGWIGFLAFVFFGALAADVLAVWTLRRPAAALAEPWIVAASLLLALCCALVESLPTTLDDNLTVPIAGAAGVALLAHVQAGTLGADVDVLRRAALGLALNAALAALAWRARALDRAGAVSAVAIGTAITVGQGLPGLAVMVAFFVAGSAATRLGYGVKAARGIAQGSRGARGWRSAWANGAVPAVLALLALLAPAEAQPSWALAYAASVAAAAADTCSSEIGKAYARRTYLVTTLRPVSPGTEGALSLVGTLAGVAGAALVGVVGWAGGLYSGPAAAVVAVAGVLGSLAESVLGTLTEGRGRMGDHALNAVNTAIGAGLALLMARASAYLF